MINPFLAEESVHWNNGDRVPLTRLRRRSRELSTQMVAKILEHGADRLIKQLFFFLAKMLVNSIKQIHPIPFYLQFKKQLPRK